MARDIDYVIDAAGDPVVAILVAPTAVTRKVVAFVLLEIGLLKALVIAVHRAHLPRPRSAHGQDTRDAVAFYLRAFLRVEHDRLNAEEGEGGRTGLGWGRPGQRRDEDAASLGLPPRIDDGAAFLAGVFVIPAPSLWVDRLADRAQQAQGRHLVASRPLLAGRGNGADGGRGRVELIDVPLLNGLPVAVRVGVRGNGFKHHGGRAVGHRAVDDVRVAGDPADVGRAEVDVAVVVVEYVLMSGARIDHVPADRVLHTLGLPRRSRGIENEKRILGVHDLTSAIGVRVGHQLVPPAVAASLHIHGKVRAIDHDAGRYLGVHARIRVGHSLIGHGLHQDGLVAAMGAVAGDDSGAGGIHDAVGERVRGKAAEHNRMDRANAGAGQHGNGQFGHHRQVDGDAVALVDAARLEHVGEFADLFVQFLVGQRGIFPRLVALPDDGDLIAFGIEVPVEAIVHNVGLAAGKPLNRNRPRVHVVIVRPHSIPLFEPVELRGLSGPKRRWIGDGASVFFPVLVHAFDVSAVA